MRFKYKTHYIYWSVFKILFIVCQLIGLRIEKGTIIHGIVYFFLFFAMFLFLDSIAFALQFLWKKISKSKRNVLNNKHLFFSTVLLMTVLGISILLICYPGLITYDTMTQLREAGNELPLTDHHPVLLTFFLKVFCDMGNAMGNCNMGIFAFLSIQIILLSCVCAYSVCLINTITGNTTIVRIIKCLYIINPPLWNYAIMAGKDSSVAILLLLYICSIAEVVFIQKKLTKRLFLQIMLSAILASLIRHNCFYAFILSIPILIIYLEKEKKHAIALYISILLSVIAIHLVYYNFLNIEKTSDAEKYSILFQTTARMLYDNKDSLSAKELDIIKNFMGDSDEIIRQYNSNLADPVNKLYNNSVKPTQKISFFLQWFRLFFKYPKSYIKAIANQDYGYFYLYFKKNIKPIFFIKETDIYYNRITSYQFSLKNPERVLMIDKIMNKLYSVPYLSIFLSLGFYSWVLLYLLFNGILKKNHKAFVIITQIFVYFLSVLLGPANGYYRYMIPIIVCIPFLICMNQKSVDLH